MAKREGVWQSDGLGREVWQLDVYVAGGFFTLEQCIMHRHFIIMIEELMVYNMKSGFGNIYASNEELARSEVWDEIMVGVKILWVLRHDFNVVRK